MKYYDGKVKWNCPSWKGGINMVRYDCYVI